MLKLYFLVIALALTGCTSLEYERGEYHTLRGANFYQEGKTGKALREYKLALKKNQSDDVALREIALIYFERKKYDVAMEYYEKVLELDAKDHQALKNLAYIFYLQNNNEKAREYLNRILEEHRDSFVLKVEGLILVKENRKNEAHIKFKEAIKVATNYDRNLFDLIYENLEALSRKNEFKKVMDDSVEKFCKDRKFILYYHKIIGDEFNDWIGVSKAVKSYLVYNREDQEIYNLLAYSYERIANLSKFGLTQQIIEKKFKKSKEDGVVKK